MSLVNFAVARRPPRVKVHPRRPAVPPARLAWPNTRRTSDRRARRLSTVRVRVRSNSRIRDMSPRLPLGIELVRAVLLLAVAVLAVVVALPALLDFAATPLH
jgi:hypothetical protein